MQNYTKIEKDILFSFYRGDDFAFKGQVKDVDTGLPIDITGWELKCTLKRSYSISDDSASVKVSTGILDNVDSPSGIFYVHLPSIQTANLIPTKYYFDLQRELEGTVITVIQGRVGVKADLTQRTTNNPSGETVTLEQIDNKLITQAELDKTLLDNDVLTLPIMKASLKFLTSKSYAEGATDQEIDDFFTNYVP